MNCDEVRLLLSAHLDGELDVVRDAGVVAHLDGCSACADAALAHAARRGLIQEKLTRFAAPADLCADIVAGIRAADRPASRSWTHLVFRQVLPIAAGLIVVGGFSFQWGATRERKDAAVVAFVSAYVRAANTGHSTDVASTDQHTVKPWFVGKLDFTPVVRDLSSDGFPLIGGRIDEVNGRPAAVLVFQRRKHVIDLFIAPDGVGAVPSTTSRSGFNLVAWQQGDQQCVAVSDLAAPELEQFAKDFQSTGN